MVASGGGLTALTGDVAQAQNAATDGCRTGVAGRLAILLLLGAVLLPATPALAQSQTIVSNVDADPSPSAANPGGTAAASFTTGNRTGGYVLTKATILVTAAANGTVVSIYNDASGNLPDAMIGTLAGPATLTPGTYTFTSSVGIGLAASTTYHLVVTFFAGGALGATTFTNQTTTTDGWDIGNRTLAGIGRGGWNTTLFGSKILRFSLSARPFGFGNNTVADQRYTAGTTIADLTLPPAGGGSNLSYMLEPEPPDGLSFNSNSNPPVLSGKPTTEMAASAYTYTATVASSSTSLSFTIAVVPRAVRMRLKVFLEGPLE